MAVSFRLVPCIFVGENAYLKKEEECQRVGADAMEHSASPGIADPTVIYIDYSPATQQVCDKILHIASDPLGNARFIQDLSEQSRSLSVMGRSNAVLAAAVNHSTLEVFAALRTGKIYAGAKLAAQGEITSQEIKTSRESISLTTSLFASLCDYETEPDTLEQQEMLNAWNRDAACSHLS